MNHDASETADKLTTTRLQAPIHHFPEAHVSMIGSKQRMAFAGHAAKLGSAR